MAEPMRGIVLSRVEYPIFHLALAAVGASLLNPKEANQYIRSLALYDRYTSKAINVCVHEFNNRTLNRVSTQVRSLTNFFYGNTDAILVDAITDMEQTKARYGFEGWLLRLYLREYKVSVGVVVDQLEPMWPSPCACFEMCVEQLIPTVCDLVESLYESGGWDEEEQIAF